MRYGGQLADSRSEALHWLRTSVLPLGQPVFEAERKRKTRVASAAIAVGVPGSDLARIIAAPEVGGLCLALLVHRDRSQLGLARALSLATAVKRAKHGRVSVPVVSWVEREHLVSAPDWREAPFPPFRYALHDPESEIGGLPTHIAVGMWGEERTLDSHSLRSAHERRGYKTLLPADNVLDLHVTLNTQLAMAYGMRKAGTHDDVLRGPMGLARRTLDALTVLGATPELPGPLEDLLDALP